MATISKSGNILIKKITKMEEDNSIPFEYVITDEALLEKIKNVDGEGSGLDADMIDGKQTSSSSQPNVIPVTDSSGKIPNEFIDSESLGGGSSSAVTAPTISGPSQVKYDTEFPLTASGSITAFADSGVTIDHYEWLLPDNTTATGNSITYTAPDSSHMGETLVFKCKAIDTLGNESRYTEYDVTVSNNTSPIIDSVDWDSEELYDPITYTVTITAHDLESDPLQYKVTCNDPNVTITPNDWDSNNSFNVSFPDYTEDTTVTFTYHVKDSTDEVTQDEDKIVHDGLPIGDIGVFGGGYNSGNHVNTIDYITISSLGNAQDFGDLTVSRYYLVATSNGTNDRGVFGGGYNSSGYLNTIDYITISTLGNAQDFGDLTVNRYVLAATSNGTNDRGVFGGGYNGSNRLNTIDYITISTLGNASDFGDLTENRQSLAATSNGTNDRGVFGGGWNSSNLNTIDYITISTLGNAQDFGDLTVNRDGLAAISNGTNDRGVFGGGYNGSSRLNTIDYITISTLGNAHDFGDLTINRDGLTATSNEINNRGVFGGGWNSNYLNTIDYITISSLGNAHDFGDLTIRRDYLAATSNA